MNFKIGVALSDINYHMKRGNRMQLIAEIDMISKYGAVKKKAINTDTEHFLGFWASEIILSLNTFFQKK